MRFLIFILTSSCAAQLVNPQVNAVPIELKKNVLTKDQMIDLVAYALSMPGWALTLNDAGIDVPLDSFDQTEGYGDFFVELIDGWTILFTPNWYAVPLEDGRVVLTDGITYPDQRLMLLTVHDCQGHSAFIHEFGHVIRDYFGMSEDLAHSDYKFWSPINRLMQDMTWDLCPDDYIPKEPIIIEINY